MLQVVLVEVLAFIGAGFLTLFGFSITVSGFR